MKTSPWGDMTDAEWREVKGMLGDMALENPPLAVRVVNDWRRERGQPPIREATVH
jgi:hypothetical protein